MEMCRATSLPIPAIVTAGGTISMSGATSRSGNAGEALWTSWFKNLVPVFPGRAPDSSAFTTHHWAVIARTVLAEAQTRPVILTHGTDTLEQTAFLLSLLTHGRIRFPVVITGAYTPPSEPGSDAILNLGHSLRVALDPQTPPLVYAVIGKEIHLGSRVKKVAGAPWKHQGIVHSYFESVGGPVGLVMDGEENVFYGRNFLDSQKHPGSSFALFDSLPMPSPVRILFQSEGGMSLPHRWLLKAGKEGAPIVLDSKDLSPLLNPIKASLKLGLLLLCAEPGQLLPLMNTDVAGEICDGGISCFPLPRMPQEDAVSQVLLANQFLTPQDIEEAVSKLTPPAPLRSHPQADHPDFQCIRGSHPVLDAIAHAVERGIEVVMASNAHRLVTDLREYEVGRMLALMGARDGRPDEPENDAEGGIPNSLQAQGRALHAILEARPEPGRPRLVIIGSGSGHLPIGIETYQERLTAA